MKYKAPTTNEGLEEKSLKMIKESMKYSDKKTEFQILIILTIISKAVDCSLFQNSPKNGQS